MNIDLFKRPKSNEFVDFYEQVDSIRYDEHLHTDTWWTDVWSISQYRAECNAIMFEISNTIADTIFDKELWIKK